MNPLFELPLPPFSNAYGRVQRALAAQYRVTLIPKRCLTAVFGVQGSTLDGLHLSQVGHNALADRVNSMLVVSP